MCNIIAIAKLHIKAKENDLHCGNMITELDTEKKYHPYYDRAGRLLSIWSKMKLQDLLGVV